LVPALTPFYRDVEELLAERGVQVDHVTSDRWVRRFTPILAEAARCARHAIGWRWQVDETYVKVAGWWRYVYRAVDEYGQVIDVYVSPRRDSGAARWFFHRALASAVMAPVEVVTDQAACYLRVLEKVLPAAWHRIERYANNRIEADHAQLKRRLRPMRGLKTDITARMSSPGMPSFRTFAVATTNSPPLLHQSYVSRLPSMNSPKQCDPRPTNNSTGNCDQTTQQSRSDGQC
jgi:transposase-like protein